MEIEFLILADSVQAVSGKMYMLGGGWDRWSTGAFPAQTQIGIAIGLLVPWEDTNRRQRVSVTVVDEDGKAVIPAISSEFEVGRPAGMREGVSQRAMIAINAGFPLPHPGRYEVVASAPDGIEKKVSFEAVVQSTGSVRL